MIRSNIGNVVTNAAQTFNISLTQASKILRRKEDASTALNSSSPTKNALTPQIESASVGENVLTSPVDTSGVPDVPQYDTIEDMGDEFNERVYQMTQRFLPSDSPQAQAIGQYIRNNLDWFERRRNRDGGM